MGTAPLLVPKSHVIHGNPRLSALRRSATQPRGFRYHDVRFEPPAHRARVEREGESDRDNVGNWALKIGRLPRVRSGPKLALGQRVGARCLCMPVAARPGSRVLADPDLP